MRFEKLKTAHSPSVYWGKIIFLYRNGVQISKIHLTQKNDTSAKLTIAPDTALFVHFWLQSKKKLLGQNYAKKWLFGMRKLQKNFSNRLC